MGDKTKSMVSAVALAAFNMMGTAGAHAAATKAPLVPAQAAAPVSAPKDSLKADMYASHADFAKAAEKFGRDSLGLNLLVYDIDDFKKKPHTIQGRLPPLPNGVISRAVLYQSPHGEDRVEAHRQLFEQAYLERVQQQVSEKGLVGDDAAQIDKAARDMATQVSQRVIERANEEETSKDVNVKADESVVAGEFLPFVMPDVMRHHGIDVQVVGLDSALFPQLASAAEQADRRQCITPDAADRHIEALERLHSTYHEIAHAYSITRPRVLPFALENNGRDGANFNENVANGTAAIMVLRDLGQSAVSYLKKNAYGEESYTHHGSDINHYTASITLAAIKQFEKGAMNYSKMTPETIVHIAEDASKTLALRPEDMNTIRQYRFDLEHGQMVDFSILSRAQSTYTDIALVAGPEREKAVEQLKKQASTMSAGQTEIHHASVAASQLCQASLRPALEQLSDEQSATVAAPLSPLKLGPAAAKPAP